MGSNTPEFDHLNFDNEFLEKLWTQIKELLHEHGRVHNYEIVNKHGVSVGEYSDAYIKKRVLPDLRDELAEQDIIETEEVRGKRNTRRILWKLPDTSDSSNDTGDSTA